MSRALDFFISPAPEPPTTDTARVPRKQRTRAHARRTSAAPAPGSAPRAPAPHVPPASAPPAL
ncbi:hypothetical protein OJ997_34800, partial [Solirubrobacter phytolaccae]